jgi:GT2 family glycosyltransferase
MGAMSAPWILIPNRDGLRWLPECLGSLAATIPLGVEICVVDNASTDGGKEYIRSNFPGVRLLELEMNLGFVQAVNLGVLAAQKARAEAVLLHNNDTRVRGDWYERLADAVRRNRAYGIVGPQQVDFAGNVSRRTRAILDSASQPLREVEPTGWVEGSCMWIRAEIFDRIGYLDPVFAPAYFEEIDFCRRARRNGIGVGLATGSTIEHHGAGTSLRGPARRRQRILSERNYLVYHASSPQLTSASSLATLASRAVAHGVKAWRRGDLSLGEWAAALAELPGRLPGIAAKVHRDAENRPCSILGDRSPCTPEQRYYAACVAAGGALPSNV